MCFTENNERSGQSDCGKVLWKMEKQLSKVQDHGEAGWAVRGEQGGEPVQLHLWVIAKRQGTTWRKYCPFPYIPYNTYQPMSLLIFVLAILIITVTCFSIWLSGLPIHWNKQTTLLGRRIPFEGKCVSDDTALPEKDKAKNSKHKNSHRCMGKRENPVNGHCVPQEVFQCTPVQWVDFWQGHWLEARWSV